MYIHSLSTAALSTAAITWLRASGGLFHYCGLNRAQHHRFFVEQSSPTMLSSTVNKVKVFSSTVAAHLVPLKVRRALLTIWRSHTQLLLLLWSFWRVIVSASITPSLHCGLLSYIQNLLSKYTISSLGPVASGQARYWGSILCIACVTKFCHQDCAEMTFR